jgi:hypothetical protein
MVLECGGAVADWQGCHVATSDLVGSKTRRIRRALAAPRSGAISRIDGTASTGRRAAQRAASSNFSAKICTLPA